MLMRGVTHLLRTGSVERTVRLKPIYDKGVEAKRTFDDAHCVAEKIDRISTALNSKFFRLKSLRMEGLSLVDKIR